MPRIEVSGPDRTPTGSTFTIRATYFPEDGGVNVGGLKIEGPGGRLLGTKPLNFGGTTTLSVTAEAGDPGDVRFEAATTPGESVAGSHTVTITENGGNGGSISPPGDGGGGGGLDTGTLVLVGAAGLGAGWYIFLRE